MSEKDTKHIFINQENEIDNGEEIDLVDLVKRVLVHWKIIVVACVLFALGAFFYTTKLAEPRYQASADIYISNEQNVSEQGVILLYRSATAEDYEKAFKMWELHKEVAEAIDIPYSRYQLSELAQLKTDEDKKKIEIIFSSPSESEAVAIVNIYAKTLRRFVSPVGEENLDDIVFAEHAKKTSGGSVRKNVFLGAFLGLVLSSAAVFAVVMIDTRYKSEQDVLKYAGMKTLASIHFDEAFQKDREKRVGENGR